MSFLAIDAGNTNIVFGVMDEKDIYASCHLETDPFKTADEYAVIFHSLLDLHQIAKEDLEGGIISSVVPSLQETMQEAAARITGKPCLVVGPGLKNGLHIRIDDPAQLGSDSVVNAVAAIADYPLPAVIFDMGTATTVSVLDEKGAYLGGLLLPGVEISLEALAHRASQLPHVSLSEGARQLIGTNTGDCMKGGVLYGSAAMLDGLVARLSEELGKEPMVIATGMIAEKILPYCKTPVVYEKDLLLKGLRRIYLKNHK